MALLQGMIWGSANAGISSPAKQLGDSGMAGFVWGAMEVTSALAGVATTLRPGALDLTVRLRSAIVQQAVLLVPLLIVDNYLGPAALAGIGLAVAPHLIAVFGLAERVAPPARMGEAMALLGSGLIAGQGIAAANGGSARRGFGLPGGLRPELRVRSRGGTGRSRPGAAEGLRGPGRGPGRAAAHGLGGHFGGGPGPEAQGRTGGVHPKICRPVA
ncbi:hypothetical protein [Streptomyces sp. NPDC059909]|uniref:hypothetical protein n=1 Tax=Streptomyces sp. NPDC059909 TaxID=3346998 RepID=UPI00364A15F9